MLPADQLNQNELGCADSKLERMDSESMGETSATHTWSL